MTGDKQQYPQVEFPEGFFEDPDEFKVREVCPDVIVHLENGQSYILEFLTPLRQKQECESTFAANIPYSADPYLVLVPEVTKNCIVGAVQCLAQTKYFDFIVPTSTCSLNSPRT